MKPITAKELTAEEKLRLICGQGFWRTDDLGGKLPQIFMSDGPVGLRTMKAGEDGKEYTVPATAYPSIQMLANTWSTACAQKMGECLADDCIERGVDLLLRQAERGEVHAIELAAIASNGGVSLGAHRIDDALGRLRDVGRQHALARQHRGVEELACGQRDGLHIKSSPHEIGQSVLADRGARQQT